MVTYNVVVLENGKVKELYNFSDWDKAVECKELKVRLNPSLIISIDIGHVYKEETYNFAYALLAYARVS